MPVGEASNQHRAAFNAGTVGTGFVHLLASFNHRAAGNSFGELPIMKTKVLGLVPLTLLAAACISYTKVQPRRQS